MRELFWILSTDRPGFERSKLFAIGAVRFEPKPRISPDGYRPTTWPQHVASAVEMILSVAKPMK